MHIVQCCANVKSNVGTRELRLGTTNPKVLILRRFFLRSAKTQQAATSKHSSRLAGESNAQMLISPVMENCAAV